MRKQLHRLSYWWASEGKDLTIVLAAIGAMALGSFAFFAACVSVVVIAVVLVTS